MVAKSVAPVKKASAVKKDTKKKPHKERVTCQRINERAEIAVRKHITDLGFPEQCARLLQCTLAGNVTRQKNFEINARYPFSWKIVGCDGEITRPSVLSLVLYKEGRPSLPAALKPAIAIACLPELLTERPILKIFEGKHAVTVEKIAKPLPAPPAAARNARCAAVLVRCALVRARRGRQIRRTRRGTAPDDRRPLRCEGAAARRGESDERRRVLRCHGAEPLDGREGAS